MPVNMRRHPRGPKGFTLVELIIAMALVGVLTVVIFGLFTRTSDSLSEVKELSMTLDQARFAMAMVRQDLQSAGAQATPNASEDPFVRPPVVNENIHALMIYDGWENSRDVYDDSLVDGDDNPGSAFSGFVVLGAMDFPQSFLAEDMNPNPPGATFAVRQTERGVGRLNVIDPFDLFAGTACVQGDQQRLVDNMTGRLLRVMDGQGYFQFSPISQATITGNIGDEVCNPDDPASDTRQLQITASSVRFRQPGEISGLELFMEDDEALDMALIDAYWYRVRVDPLDAANLQLVRERLDASELIASTTLTESNLMDMMIPGDRLVVANQVVDFRVWFDCVPTSGQWAPVDRKDDWEIVDGAGCLDVNLAQSDPQRLRIANLRLSLRTPTENTNRPHLELVDGWEGFEEPNGPMITYNVFPWARGSAGVVTLQSSVELTNFAMRGVL